MAMFDWKRLLATWSVDVLERLDDEPLGELPKEAAAARWLGFPPATEEAIRAAEERIRVPLPASYKRFLRVSNGFLRAGDFVQRLYPVEEIARFAERRPAQVAAWQEDEVPIPDEDYFVYGKKQDTAHARRQYLTNAIEIGIGTGSEWPLLIPDVPTLKGECEAWLLASWLAGANRYRTFREMMVDLHGRFFEGNPRLRTLKPRRKA